MRACARRTLRRGPIDRPWALGLWSPIVVTLAYLRRNRVQAATGEHFGASRPTVIRAVTALTPVLGRMLVEHEPVAEDLDPRTQDVVHGTLLPCGSWHDAPTGRSRPRHIVATRVRNPSRCQSPSLEGCRRSRDDCRFDRGSARDRLLAAAAECFYDQWVNGNGIDTISATAGVAKMSLHNNFNSKDDLVLAYLHARHEEWLDLYRRRLAKATDARRRVGAVCDSYIDHAEQAYRHGFRGCGLLNAAAELLAGVPGRQLVRRHKEEVEALLAAHLAELDALPPTRVADLAEQLSYLLEGAMARAGLEGDSARLHRARELALRMVDSTIAVAPR